jgi:hypothetical protein
MVAPNTAGILSGFTKDVELIHKSGESAGLFLFKVGIDKNPDPYNDCSCKRF